MSRLTVGSLEGLSENSNVISVPAGHTLNAVDGLQIGGVALGTATSFTPSWATGLTVGNATESWYYTQINDLVLVQGSTTLGSTSTITGNVAMDYPIGTPIVASYISAGHAHYVDADGTNALGITLLSPTDVSLREYNVSGSFITFGVVNANSPFTWTTGDEFRLSFIYQIS